MALLDSGSPISFIKNKFINPEVIIPLDKTNLEYHGVNNSKLQLLGKTKAMCEMRNCAKEIELLVVKDETMSSPVILVRDTFRTFGLGLSNQQFTEKTKNDYLTEIMNIEVDKPNIADYRY